MIDWRNESGRGNGRNATMADTPDTIWVKVYDGEGGAAKLIFEGTPREWQNYMTTRGWDTPKESPSQKPEDD